MSNLPAVRSTFDITTVNNKINYAQQLATAGMLPAAFKNNPGNVLWAVEYGEALGIPAVIAVTGIHVMNGKPTASAGLISALVRRAGHKLRVYGDEHSATAQIIRGDDPDFTFEVTWTMDMARKAGLLSNSTWKNYPASMLKSRAITQVARDACQEALNGIQYTPEELGAAVELDEAGEQVVVTQVTHHNAPPTQALVRAARRQLAERLGWTQEMGWNEGDAGYELFRASNELWAASGFPQGSEELVNIDEVEVFIRKAVADYQAAQESRAAKAETPAAAAQEVDEDGAVDAVVVEDETPAATGGVPEGVAVLPTDENPFGDL